MRPTNVLVVAKAPVAGLAKTRLIPALGPAGAADVAAAALLDTLDAARVAAGRLGGRVVVALTGDLDQAGRRERLREALAAATSSSSAGSTSPTGSPRRTRTPPVPAAARCCRSGWTPRR